MTSTYVRRYDSVQQSAASVDQSVVIGGYWLAAAPIRHACLSRSRGPKMHFPPCSSPSCAAHAFVMLRLRVGQRKTKQSGHIEYCYYPLPHLHSRPIPHGQHPLDPPRTRGSMASLTIHTRSSACGWWIGVITTAQPAPHHTRSSELTTDRSSV